MHSHPHPHPQIEEDSTLESQARNETICRGCQEEKEIGLVVCWDCFKYRHDIIPFKEWGGTLSSWLREFNLE